MFETCFEIFLNLLLFPLSSIFHEVPWQNKSEEKKAQPTSAALAHLPSRCPPIVFLVCTACI
jgi:hypothetical protein